MNEQRPYLVGKHGPELCVPKETRMKRLIRLIRWLKGFLPVTRRQMQRDVTYFEQRGHWPL